MVERKKTDQELVALALADRHAFAAIVERYERPMGRYARRLGADDELVKDILQESFIKVYIKLNDYDSSLSFAAWLYRIVHNEVVNQFRRAQSRPRVVRREEDLALFDTIPDELDIAAEASAQETREAVRAALMSMEARYRDVLVLRFLEERSYDEISDILELPPGTVATYLSRGKAKLRERLKDCKSLDV